MVYSLGQAVAHMYQVFGEGEGFIGLRLNMMIMRDENGKLFIRNLEMSILCDDLLDICEQKRGGACGK